MITNKARFIFLFPWENFFFEGDRMYAISEEESYGKNDDWKEGR